MKKLKIYQQQINNAFAHRHDKHFSWIDYLHTILLAVPIGFGVGLVFGIVNKHYGVSILMGLTQGFVIGTFLTFASQLSLYLFDLINWKPVGLSVAFLVVATNCFLGVQVIEFITTHWFHLRPNPTALIILMVIFYTSLGMMIFSRIRQKDKFNNKITEQEVKLLELKQLKTQAELDALHAKVNPHFLYNALNSIASLVHSNPDKAEQMTLLLSKFFRYNTNRQNDHMTTIGEELEMVETYLEIEKVRFGNRLQYHLQLPDTARNYIIPRFLLQPLVENALKHGIAKLPDKGTLNLTVSLDNELIKIIIADNGPAFSDSMQPGYGLQSTRDKLELLFPGKADFYFENSPGKQLVITLKKMLVHEYPKQPIQTIQNSHYR